VASDKDSFRIPLKKGAVLVMAYTTACHHVNYSVLVPVLTRVGKNPVFFFNPTRVGFLWVLLGFVGFFGVLLNFHPIKLIFLPFWTRELFKVACSFVPS
jgi:hypothetical protein